MSTQDDFVPKRYMKWMKDTQDNVPSEFTGTEARAFVALKLKEELGLIFDDVFESWDDIPLGEKTALFR
jgi:predicted unusual protein kinase regulating ubiquinone biosynthesis (AarF/ABC1/UbiB family)